MMRFFTLVLLGLVLAGVSNCDLRSPLDFSAVGTSSPDLPAEATDWLVVPGQRVGPITAQTTRADLAAIYGEAALTDGPIPVGEGFTEPGTVVSPDPSHRFTVVWADTAQTRPQLVRDFGPAWQTPEGLGVGVPYSTLKAALGNFGIYGFEWDYGGTVVLADSQLAQYQDLLWLRMAPAEAAIAEHSAAYEALLGDQVFASGNPNLELLNLEVIDMVVSLDAVP
ncbi:hypothetical protein IQ254_10065 [Nodosilinea sp. LEGE 07088]|uniref:hypothetical protein n=1 Tax=Nodosilinea sp. LEGE 07088 TaxID=2777968 RepID=UPI001881A02C|nr:hypothetical protein [Nodosilinea sp. LEGE 07088]MBE9137552.1 hypothetical protein [Nodosilinea sp. LEGE 07088]